MTVSRCETCGGLGEITLIKKVETSGFGFTTRGVTIDGKILESEKVRCPDCQGVGVKKNG